MSAAPAGNCGLGAVVFFAPPIEIHPIAWPIHRPRQCRGEWLRLGITDDNGDERDD
jgi:hypothetical protein